MTEQGAATLAKRGGGLRIKFGGAQLQLNTGAEAPKESPTVVAPPKVVEEKKSEEPKPVGESTRILITGRKRSKAEEDKDEEKKAKGREERRRIETEVKKEFSEEKKDRLDEEELGEEDDVDDDDVEAVGDDGHHGGGGDDDDEDEQGQEDEDGDEDDEQGEEYDEGDGHSRKRSVHANDGNAPARQSKRARGVEAEHAPVLATGERGVHERRLPLPKAPGARPSSRRQEAVAQLEVRKAALVERLLGRTSSSAKNTNATTTTSNGSIVATGTSKKALPLTWYRTIDKVGAQRTLFIPTNEFHATAIHAPPRPAQAQRCAAQACGGPRRYMTKSTRQSVCSLACYRAVTKNLTATKS